MKRWYAAIAAVLIVGQFSWWKATALAVVLLIGWCVFLLFSPARKCVVCKGLRRAKRYRWFGRAGKCPKCNGQQRHLRLGAVRVHRFFWIIVGQRWMEWRRENGVGHVQVSKPGGTPLPRTWAEYASQQLGERARDRVRG